MCEVPSLLAFIFNPSRLGLLVNREDPNPNGMKRKVMLGKAVSFWNFENGIFIQFLQIRRFLMKERIISYHIYFFFPKYDGARYDPTCVSRYETRVGTVQFSRARTFKALAECCGHRPPQQGYLQPIYGSITLQPW